MTSDLGPEPVPVPSHHGLTPDPSESDLPGELRCLRKAGRKSWEYINKNTGTVEIKFSSNFASRLPISVFTSRLPSSVSYQGSTYEWRRVGKRKLLASRRVRDLVNVRTGSLALRMSGVHFNGHAGTKMVLGEREFTFPNERRNPVQVDVGSRRIRQSDGRIPLESIFQTSNRCRRVSPSPRSSSRSPACCRVITTHLAVLSDRVALGLRCDSGIQPSLRSDVRTYPAARIDVAR